MALKVVCDCGLSLAQAIGASVCAACGGEGCPRCASGLASEGSCFWCGDAPLGLAPFESAPVDLTASSESDASSSGQRWGGGST